MSLVTAAVDGVCISPRPLIFAADIITEGRAVPEVGEPLQSAQALDRFRVLLEFLEESGALSGRHLLWHPRQVRHRIGQPFDKDAVTVDDGGDHLQGSPSIFGRRRTTEGGHEFRQFWLSVGGLAAHLGSSIEMAIGMASLPTV